MQATVMQGSSESRPETDDLVRRAQSGDLEAFEALYREHCGRIYGLCLRISRDPAQAEELTQEAFIRAWRKLDSFRSGTRFPAWLAKVAVNVALGDRRSRGRRGLHEVQVDDPDRWDPAARAPTPGAGIDLERAIASLPPGARKVFVLYEVEGFRHQEIADLLGLSQGTSKAQLHRARRILRERLAS